MWPHVHLIPRRKGDTPNPRGGVRHVIPCKGDYDEAECVRTSGHPGEHVKATRMPMSAPFKLEEKKLTKNEVNYIDESVGPWSTWKSITN